MEYVLNDHGINCSTHVPEASANPDTRAAAEPADIIATTACTIKFLTQPQF
jgi:hypothetical protein